MEQSRGVLLFPWQRGRKGVVGALQSSRSRHSIFRFFMSADLKLPDMGSHVFVSLSLHFLIDFYFPSRLPSCRGLSHRTAMKLLYSPCHFGIPYCRDCQHVIGQGPNGTRLQGLDFLFVLLLLLLLLFVVIPISSSSSSRIQILVRVELLSDGALQRRVLGTVGGSHVSNETQTIAVELSGRALEGNECHFI
jgi:hypothetical protein